MQAQTDDEKRLIEAILGFANDPLGYALFAFPWGKKGTALEREEGPDTWQTKVLQLLGAALRREGIFRTMTLAAVRLAVASGHGIGKRVSNSVIVETFDGPRPWGEVREGTRLIGSDGKPTVVLKSHPDVVRPVYRVRFDDDSETLVDGEHLWAVRGRQERRRGASGWRTMTTEQILKAGVKRPNGNAMARQWEIPTVQPVDWPAADLPLDPFVFGLWLADGTRGTPGFCKPYRDLHDYVRGLGFEVTLRADQKSCYLPGRLRQFEETGVFDLLANAKHVPRKYKYASRAQRRALLDGLLTGDGEVHGSGSVGYSSVSERLVDDVIWLARSLGCKAQKQPTAKSGRYRSETGEIVQCQPCYRATLSLDWNPFKVRHKAERYKPSERRYTVRWIDSIEYSHDEEGHCVTVDAPDHLYCVNDFILTHNTALVAWIILWFISTRPDPQIVVTANTGNQLRTKTWRELAKWHMLAVNKHWFQWSATQFKMSGRPETWFATAVPWSEHNSSAFAGTHAAHVLMIFDEACHDDQTDVMTDRGWRRFADLDGTERLLTMDPETREATYQRPTRLFSMPYVGPMYYYRQRGADFAVTPRHKMVVRTPDGRGGLSDYRRVEVQHLTRCEHRFPQACLWRGEARETFDLPPYQGLRKAFPARAMPIVFRSPFLGWYLSEGHLACYPDGRAHSVGLTHRDPEPLAALARELGYTPRIYRNATTPQVMIGDTQLAEWLRQWGRGALEKRVPDFIRELSPAQIRVFLDAYRAGDGYLKEGRAVLYTSSGALADGLQELLLLTGSGASLSVRRIAEQSKRIGERVVTSSVDGYVVRETEPSDISYRPGNMVVRPYKGRVYCAEVPPHHTLLTRRNGCVLWSGNSEIADAIWEVAEGALSTGALDGGTTIWLAFGNPTVNTGRFRQCWTKFRKRWLTMKVDSRTAKKADKNWIKELIEDWGEDSDYVRVRIRGEFPRAGPKQFIGNDLVEAAQARYKVLEDRFIPSSTPKLMGVDVARQGSGQTVIVKRLGRKMHKDIKRFRIPDLMQVASMVAHEINEWQPDVVFIDAVGMGAGVFDRLIQLGYTNVVAVLSGEQESVADRTRHYNRRIEMWDRMRAWLATGAIPDDKELYEDLIGPELHYDEKMRMKLERKEDMEKRGLPSPDTGDALALTFADPVPLKRDDIEASGAQMTEPEVG